MIRVLIVDDSAVARKVKTPASLEAATQRS